MACLRAYHRVRVLMELGSRAGTDAWHLSRGLPLLPSSRTRSRSTTRWPQPASGIDATEISNTVTRSRIYIDYRVIMASGTQAPQRHE